jgi:segregation and condensation protein B
LDSESTLDNTIKIEETENRLENMIDDESAAAVESLLFASPEPLTDKEIGHIIGRKKSDVTKLIDKLNSQYEQWGRSFRIELFGRGYRFYTIPEFYKYISRLAEIPRPVKLSKAGLEILSIVAYKQPIIKSELEKIRGVNSDGVIKTLMERGLIEPCGRTDGPGRPVLYRTTQDFLEFFGISDLSDLPDPEVFEVEPEIPKSVTILRSPESAEEIDSQINETE